MNFNNKIDIWGLGCLFFELLTLEPLFSPCKGKNYSWDEDHLGQIIEVIGPIPRQVIAASPRKRKFFDNKGQLIRIKIDSDGVLREVLCSKFKLKREIADEFFSFLEDMLKIDHFERKEAVELFEHPWFERNFGDLTSLTDLDFNQTILSRISNIKLDLEKKPNSRGYEAETGEKFSEDSDTSPILQIEDDRLLFDREFASQFRYVGYDEGIRFKNLDRVEDIIKVPMDYDDFFNF